MSESPAGDPRTRLFQWITDRYPTQRIQGSSLARAGYRLLLELIRPDGRIVLRTPRYRIRYTRLPRRQIARYIAIKRAYEPLVTSTLAELLQGGGVCVDVGANIGHFTMVAGMALAGRGHVLACEPVPELLAELQANLALNGIDNVSPVQAALGEANGRATIFRHQRNPGGHSMVEANVYDGVGETTEVPVCTLDALVEQQRPGERVAAIKIDVEGYEVAVLAGAQGVLARHKPAVIFEYWPFGITRAGHDAGAPFALLSRHGYRFQHIDEAGGTLTASSAEALIAACDPPERDRLVYVLATC